MKFKYTDGHRLKEGRLLITDEHRSVIICDNGLIIMQSVIICAKERL